MRDKFQKFFVITAAYTVIFYSVVAIIVAATSLTWEGYVITVPICIAVVVGYMGAMEAS